MTSSIAAAFGTVKIGGDLEVNRLGYGSELLTGQGMWGEPDDRDECIAVLRRLVERGVNYIDTADAYGPEITEGLIHEALHPYADDVVIATKAGLVRWGPNEMGTVCRPEYLRQQCEMCLRRLGVEALDVFQLHRIDPEVPMADQVGELANLQEQGKIRHIGLCGVDVPELEEAQRTARIATVQNVFNLAHRDFGPLLDYCATNGVALVPWYPLEVGDLADGDAPLARIAADTGASPSQVALAWLLRRSPAVIGIPGATTVADLEQNLGAAGVELTDDQLDALSALA